MKVLGTVAVIRALLGVLVGTMAGFAFHYEGRGLQAFVAGAVVAVCLSVGWFAAWAVDLAEEQGM